MGERVDLLVTDLGAPGHLHDPAMPAGYVDRVNRQVAANWAETAAHHLARHVEHGLKATGSLFVYVPGLHVVGDPLGSDVARSAAAELGRRYLDPESVAPPSYAVQP